MLERRLCERIILSRHAVEAARKRLGFFAWRSKERSIRICGRSMIALYDMMPGGQGQARNYCRCLLKIAHWLHA